MRSEVLELVAFAALVTRGDNNGEKRLDAASG
jgi:hypothetical protein